MLAIGLGIAMSVLDAAVANIALPVIAADFHAAPAESVWVVNAYQLAVVVDAAALRFARRAHRLPPRLSRRPHGLHPRFARLRAVGQPADADRRPVAQGLGAGGDVRGQWRAGALHLSAVPARSRHRPQRLCRLGLFGDRAVGRLGDPGDRAVAMAVRDQCADRRPQSLPRGARAAAFRSLPPAVRSRQRFAQRARLRPVLHRRRHADPWRRASAARGLRTRRRRGGGLGADPPRIGGGRAADPDRPAAHPHFRAVGRDLDLLLHRPVARLRRAALLFRAGAGAQPGRDRIADDAVAGGGRHRRAARRAARRPLSARRSSARSGWRRCRRGWR